MVENRQDTRNSSDILAGIHLEPGQKVITTKLTDDDVNSILQAARPHGGRRRDGMFMSLQRQWWVNLLNYIGIQNLEVPEVLENVDPGLLMEKSTYIANHILRYVMSNVGRLTSARVDWSVVPNTPDQIDQDGARVGQHMLDYLHTYLKLPRERMTACLWLDICGTCFTYADWDKTKGQTRRFYYDPMTGQPTSKQQLTPEQQQWLDGLGAFEDATDGDYDFEVLSPFQVIAPWRLVRLDRMPWVLIRRTMSIDEVWDRWPDKAPLLAADDFSVLTSGQYWSRLPTLTRRPGLGLGVASEHDDAIIVDQLWYYPSKRVPQGMTIFAAKQTILEVGEHKYKKAGLERRFPIVDYHNLRVPGRFHSMSTVEHLIGPQQEYNRGRQQTIQHRDIVSVPQWMAPIGTLAKGIVRNELGDVMEYNPRIGKPELVNPPTVGEAVPMTVIQAQQDMQMISQFSEASLGQMPQGARSGNAVAMLQERDMTGIAPTVRELEESFESLGEHLLMLAWKFQKIPRAIQIYGESRQSDIRYFVGSDLNGNCKVRVKAGSMTPKSRAATMELMQMLTSMGVVNPAMPRDQRLVMDALEVGGAERFWLLEDGHRRRARIENLMFSKPDPDPNFALPDVQPWDDPQAHYDEHMAFMVTDEYEIMHPMLKIMFQSHLQKHADQVAQAMLAQQALAAGAGGGGAEGPGGGSPQAKPLGKASQPRQNPPKSNP